MVFPREVPRAVEVMTAAAAAASSSSPTPPAHRPGKPRSRLPVPALKAWANQRLLRCVGVDGAGGDRSDTSSLAPPSSTSSSPAQGSRRGHAGAPDDGFERIRAKLMDHLREAAGRIELPAVAAGEERRKGEPATKVSVEELKGNDDDTHAAAAVPQGTPAITVSAVAAAASVSAVTPAEELPWNLRTRRPAPTSNGRHHQPNPESPVGRPPSRLRSGAPERRESALRRRRPRFSVPLTKEEIDEDVYAFTGRLAARRPKKRPRAVQRQLDMLFPGLLLSEVTFDMYQVADPPPPPPS